MGKVGRLRGNNQTRGRNVGLRDRQHHCLLVAVGECGLAWIEAQAAQWFEDYETTVPTTTESPYSYFSFGLHSFVDGEAKDKLTMKH